MKKTWLLATLRIIASMHGVAQIATDSLQPAYDKKMKNAKTLLIAVGASVTMALIALAQVTEEVLCRQLPFQGDVNENAGADAAIASTVYFIACLCLFVKMRSQREAQNKHVVA